MTQLLKKMEESLEVGWQSSDVAVGLWFSREGADWRIVSELVRSIELLFSHSQKVMIFICCGF